MLGVHPARKQYSVRFTLPEDHRDTSDEHSSSSSSSSSSSASGASSSSASQSTASKEPESAASTLRATPPPESDATMAAHDDRSWGSEEQGSVRSTSGDAHDAREWGPEQVSKSPAERMAEKEAFRKAKAALERKEQEERRKQYEMERKQQAAAKKRQEEALKAKLKAEIAALEAQMKQKKKALGIREEEETEERFEDEYSSSKKDESESTVAQHNHSSHDDSQNAPIVVPQENRYFLSNEKDTRANPATDAADYASFGVDAGPSDVKQIDEAQSQSSHHSDHHRAPETSSHSRQSRKSHHSVGEQSSSSKPESQVEVNPQRDFVSYGLERQSHAVPEQKDGNLRSDLSAKSHHSKSSGSQKTPPTETSQRSVTSSSEHRPNPAARRVEKRPSNRSDQRQPPNQRRHEQASSPKNTQQPSSGQRRPPNSGGRAAPDTARKPPTQSRDPRNQHPYQPYGPFGMERPPPNQPFPNQYAYYGYGPYGMEHPPMNQPPYNPYYPPTGGADQQFPPPYSHQQYAYGPPPQQPPYNPNYYPPHSMGRPPPNQPYDPRASHNPPYPRSAPAPNRHPEQRKERPQQRRMPPDSTPNVVHLHHQSDEESISSRLNARTTPEASQRTNASTQRRLSRSSHSSYEPYTKDGIVGFKVKEIRQDEEDDERVTPGRNQVARTNSGSSQRSGGRLPMRRNSNRKRYQDQRRQQQEDERIKNMESRPASIDYAPEPETSVRHSSDASSSEDDGEGGNEERVQSTNVEGDQNGHAAYYAHDDLSIGTEHDVEYHSHAGDPSNSSYRSEKSGYAQTPVVETVDSNSSSTEYEHDEAPKLAMSSTHSGSSGIGAPTPEQEAARVHVPRMDYNRIGSNRRMSGSGSDGTSSSESQNFSRDESEHSPSYAPQIHDSSSANANGNTVYSGENEPTSPPRINRSISFGSSSSESTGDAPLQANHSIGQSTAGNNSQHSAPETSTSMKKGTFESDENEASNSDPRVNASTSYETSSASGYSPSSVPAIRPSVSTDSDGSSASENYAAPVSPRTRTTSIGSNSHDNSHDTGTSFFEDSHEALSDKLGDDNYDVDSPEGVEDHEVILARIREHDLKRAEYQEKMAKHFSLSETDQYSKVYASGSDASDPDVHSAASLSSRSSDSIEVFSTDDEDVVGEMRQVRRGQRRSMVNAASIPRNIGGMTEHVSDDEEEEDTEIASGLSGKVDSSRNLLEAEKSLDEASGDYDEISAESGSWVEEEVFSSDGS